jgi:hypothetical protein
MTTSPPQPSDAAAGAADKGRRSRAGTPAQRVSAADRESRYRRRPPADPSTGRDPEANRVLRLVLTEPDTVAMTDQQYEQAISALSAMIVSWLQRRAHHGKPPTG